MILYPQKKTTYKKLSAITVTTDQANRKVPQGDLTVTEQRK
jgi:hypothetical protein